MTHCDTLFVFFVLSIYIIRYRPCDRKLLFFSSIHHMYTKKSFLSRIVCVTVSHSVTVIFAFPTECERFSCLFVCLSALPGYITRANACYLFHFIIAIQARLSSEACMSPEMFRRKVSRWAIIGYWESAWFVTSTPLRSREGTFNSKQKNHKNQLRKGQNKEAK